MAGKGNKACRLCLGVLFPCCILTGLLLIALATALYLKFPDIITSQVDQRVTVRKGHATYEQLVEPSIAIYKDFYFFNLTNAEEFASGKGGVIPVLQELGPYSYREYRKKDLGEPYDDLIDYTQSKTFFFDANNSKDGATEDDKICTINIPLVAAIGIAEDSFMLRLALRAAIIATRAKLYVCQPATKLAWNYTDSLVETLHLSGQYPSKYVNIQINDTIFDRNVSTINTGSKNISKNGEYVQWNGLKELTIWQNHTGANCINGTEGLFFRPNLVEGDNLTAFKDDIFRSIDLLYEGTVKPLGMKAFRYGIDNRTFLSAFSEPENARWKSWCPDGMFYLGVTQVKEIPIFGSKPHFLDGDPRLLDSVKGLKPERSEHDTIIDVEPITGANLHLKQQLQINLQVNRTKKRNIIEAPMSELEEVSGFNGTGTLYYPVLYINENAIMDEAFKQYLENKGLKEVHIFNIAVPVLFGVMIFVGVVCLLVSLFACAGFISRSRRAEEEGVRTPLLNPSN